MAETTSTPRRPIVPGPGYPSQSGIAAKAVALREQKVREPVRHFREPDKTDSPPLERLREPARPQLPVTTVGKLASGIAGVMAEVGTIKKGGYNKFHNYNYARLEDLLEAVTPLMGKHGVVVIQNEVERGVIENRITVTYEFSIIHASGEVWPERPKFTGMVMGRDSKGNWDDKAINKCHSAARKYFLLALFQVPSGDFEEPDAGPATKPEQPAPQERAGPQQQPISDQRPRTVPGPATSSQQPITDERLPHKIGFTPGMTADVWAAKYLLVLDKVESQQEFTEWDGLNDATLQRLSDKYPEIYERIRAAAEQRMEQLAPAVPDPITAMPDPKEDPGAALNWVAQGLVDAKTLPDAEAFWNTMVAPREKEFDPVDWELLLEEFKRNEIRLGSDVQEAGEDPLRSETDKDV